LKINGEAGENSIDGLDAAKPPTAMNAISPVHQLNQRLNVGSAYLAGRNQLF
jgi:hypothetical protein